MKYLALLYAEESVYDGMSEEEFGGLIGEHQSFTEKGEAKGKILGGEALQPVSTATTVRVRQGKVQITDGPYAETKEQLGGFYLLDCDNLDEAISMVQDIPDIRLGSVELRPIMEY
jgi:hypothetical protein